MTKMSEVVTQLTGMLGIAIQNPALASLAIDHEILSCSGSLRLLGKARWSTAFTERWDLMTQPEFEDTLRDKCL